jgi:hypoxanthine phosphoribosyltransferase
MLQENPMNDKHILISAAELQNTVARLAERINAAYADTDNVMALVILEGAKYFARDLLIQLRFPIAIDSLKASSYCNGTQSTGTIQTQPSDALQQKIAGKHILVIDDIYDTGKTLSHLLQWLKSCHPQSIKTCVLLEKEIAHDETISIDFPGLKVPDVFVIGYGMDFDGRYRDLPFIAELAAAGTQASPGEPGR